MSNKPAATDRRTFLGLAATTTTVALYGSGAAAATPETPPPKPRQAADDYRETDHIRAAYARMRF